jgi:hypothetical protein
MENIQLKDIIDINLSIREQKIQVASIIATVIAIVFSMWSFSTSIKTSILQSKTEIMLEQTSELPYLVAEFCSNATNVAAGLYIGVDNLDEIGRQKYTESKLEQDDSLVKIKNMIYAYGTIDAINILNEFIYITKPNTYTPITAYYLLPLLLSQVKLDVTGETVDPIIFIDGLMPQLKDHKDNVKNFISEEIDRLKLINLKNNLNSKKN